MGVSVVVGVVRGDSREFLSFREVYVSNLILLVCIKRVEMFVLGIGWWVGFGWMVDGIK